MHPRLTNTQLGNLMRHDRKFVNKESRNGQGQGSTIRTRCCLNLRTFQFCLQYKQSCQSRRSIHSAFCGSLSQEYLVEIEAGRRNAIEIKAYSRARKNIPNAMIANRLIVFLSLFFKQKRRAEATPEARHVFVTAGSHCKEW